MTEGMNVDCSNQLVIKKRTALAGNPLFVKSGCCANLCDFSSTANLILQMAFFRKTVYGQLKLHTANLNYRFTRHLH